MRRFELEEEWQWSAVELDIMRDEQTLSREGSNCDHLATHFALPVLRQAS